MSDQSGAKKSREDEKVDPHEESEDHVESPGNV